MTHVLVVDDSAVVRMAITALLSSVPGMTVAAAADPLIAMNKMAAQPPDVLILDLEMPRMDGLTFLRKIMSESPIPVVICSGIADRESELGIRALEEGAVDIVTKPKMGVKDFLEESAARIVHTVRCAAQARVRLRLPFPPPVPRLTAEAILPAPRAEITVTTDKVVAIGASTGGTEAVRTLLESMPLDCPALVVVQHMPEVFTAAFARRLDQTCRIDVKEAETGDRLIPGRALIAPGNRHTLVVRSGAQYVIEVRDGPPVSRHRPSVDVLFRSVAVAAGPNAVGAILTGMGDDGAAGLLEMRQAGAATIAQDEASCIVFGMPKEAIRRGAVEHVLPLQRIAETILWRARRDPELLPV